MSGARRDRKTTRRGARVQSQRRIASTSSPIRASASAAVARRAAARSFTVQTQRLADGNDAKLADLKVTEEGPPVQLRMSLDQKTIQAIMTSTNRGGR